MASIERTAYPRFKKVVSARELYEAFTPTPRETAWAREATRTESNLLVLVVLLKAFQRLGYFPKLAEVPAPVVVHVGRRLGLGDDVIAAADSVRTLERYRGLIRDRVGVTYDPESARKVAEEAIRAAAETKDNPADLINVAREELVKARYELPGYTTLDEMAARLRAEVNHGFFLTIEDRVGPAGKALLLGMLHVEVSTRRSRFDELKRPARRPSLSRLKEHISHLKALDATGDTGHGSPASPRPRPPTSPPRPGSSTPPTCARSASPSGWRCWPASCTRPASGPVTSWRRCSAAEWRCSTSEAVRSSTPSGDATELRPSGCGGCSGRSWRAPGRPQVKAQTARTSPGQN